MRAARILWAQVVAAFGPTDDAACRMRLHVRTPRRNKSVYDRYTNLLRATTEALSAAVGGCDRLTVEPFGFDSHLALNLQRILKEESHIDAVADPAGGSYYIEALTDSLAREAWKLLQQMEAEGGYTAAMASGSIPKALAETRAARAKAYSVAAARPGGRQQLSRRDGENAGCGSPGAGARGRAAAGAHGRAVRKDPPTHHRARAQPRGATPRCCCSTAATSR